MPPEEDTEPDQFWITSQRAERAHRWRWAERAFIATAIVVSCCVIALALVTTVWLLWSVVHFPH